jgi:hypothetical protein
VKRLKNYVFVIFVIVALFGLFLLSTPKASHAQEPRIPQPVTIENPPDRPIPVTGALTISNRVVVCPDGRCPALTLDANARNAFQKSLNIQMHPEEFRSSASFVVPAGKRLVIEFLSASHTLRQGQRSTGITLVTELNGDLGTFWVPPSESFTFNETPLNNTVNWVITGQMRVYADSGTEVFINAWRDSDSFFGVASVSVYGYLVDM